MLFASACDTVYRLHEAVVVSLQSRGRCNILHVTDKNEYDDANVLRVRYIGTTCERLLISNNNTDGDEKPRDLRAPIFKQSNVSTM